MIYREFQGSKLSLLGFGCMRLPLLEGGTIDQDTLDAMVDAAIRKGVNYFDTAWPYHGGHSETAIGKSLSRYPRESWFLADKYPGHQTAASYDPAAIFEAQLKNAVWNTSTFICCTTFAKTASMCMKTPSGESSNTSKSRSAWAASGIWASPPMPVPPAWKASCKNGGRIWSSARSS